MGDDVTEPDRLLARAGPRAGGVLQLRPAALAVRAVRCRDGAGPAARTPSRTSPTSSSSGARCGSSARTSLGTPSELRCRPARLRGRPPLVVGRRARRGPRSRTRGRLRDRAGRSRASSARALRPELRRARRRARPARDRRGLLGLAADHAARALRAPPGRPLADRASGRSGAQEREDDSDARLTWLGARADRASSTCARRRRLGYWLDTALGLRRRAAASSSRSSPRASSVVTERTQPRRRRLGDRRGDRRSSRSGEPRVFAGYAYGSGDSRPRAATTARSGRRGPGQRVRLRRRRALRALRHRARPGALEPRDPDFRRRALAARSSSLDLVYHHYRLVEPADSLRDCRLDVRPRRREPRCRPRDRPGARARGMGALRVRARALRLPRRPGLRHGAGMELRGLRGRPLRLLIRAGRVAPPIRRELDLSRTLRLPHRAWRCVAPLRRNPVKLYSGPLSLFTAKVRIALDEKSTRLRAHRGRLEPHQALRAAPPRRRRAQPEAAGAGTRRWRRRRLRLDADLRVPRGALSRAAALSHGHRGARPLPAARGGGRRDRLPARLEPDRRRLLPGGAGSDAAARRAGACGSSRASRRARQASSPAASIFAVASASPTSATSSCSAPPRRSARRPRREYQLRAWLARMAGRPAVSARWTDDRLRPRPFAPRPGA